MLIDRSELMGSKDLKVGRKCVRLKGFRFFSKKFSLIVIWAFRLHRPGTIQLAAEALVSRLKSLLVI